MLGEEHNKRTNTQSGSQDIRILRRFIDIELKNRKVSKGELKILISISANTGKALSQL